MNKIFLYAIILFIVVSCKNTNINKLSDEEIINKIFITAEEGQESNKDLKYLTDNFPKRLACYPQSIEAAKWAKTIMDELNLDTTFLQEARVMNWERGDIEIGEIRINNQVIPVNVCVLGRGISTGENGIKGQLIEMKSLEEFIQTSQDKIKGKIVFFNQAMNPELKNTFQAYGEAAAQRFVGPIMAAEKGAIGAVIRSLTTSIDTFPHTGTTRKPENEQTVPAVSIATKHANLLSELIKQNPDLTFFFKTNCKNKPDTITYNAISEIKGTEFPDEYIIVGGHLDSWDNSPGAHDDGGGCMQSIEVLRIFKKIGYKPRHSIRAVMYMDEEISQGGGRAYAEQAKIKGEKHIFAIESDRGVTQPQGFSIDADQQIIDKINSWSYLFEPYEINTFVKGGGGVDIGPLKNQGTALAGLLTDPTHYFDWHHCANDTFDKINRSEMQKGAATMAALIYLIDKYGLE